MEIALTKDENISMILSRLVPIYDIRKNIIIKKNKLELNDSYEYG